MYRVSTKFMADRSISAMLQLQAKMSETQAHLDSTKRINKPSDDPAGSVVAVDLKSAISKVDRYQTNANDATSRLEQEESILFGATNLLQRAYTLAVQGNNTGSLSEADTQAIAEEISLLVDELEGLANTRDANGEYIFSGYKSDTKPFTRTAADTYTYGGDQGQRQLQISADRAIADGDNGYDVFVNVDTGPYAEVTGIAATAFTAIDDGDLTINGISVGAIGAAASADERASQIVDAINSISDVTGVYAELDSSSTVTLSSSDDDIVVAMAATATTATTGLTAGTTATATGTRNIMETLLQLEDALNSHEQVNRYINDLTEAIGHISDVHATVGARLNAIEEQSSVNADIKLALKSHLSNVEDLDYAEAISRLSQQTIALQAAQAAYVKVQGLSLFNYI